MSNHEIERLYGYLDSMNHLRIGKPIRNWFFGDIVGWNVFSNSLIRKRITMDEIQEEIEAGNLPLEIKDPYKYTNSFVVFIKK